jgi:transcriptional regulator GlxA family with amidase domain
MRTLATLIFPGFELLDACGPLQMFGLLKDDFHLVTVAEEKGPVASNQRVSLFADMSLDDELTPDLILVPGGMGTRAEISNQRLLDWIKGISEKAELVTSVCTGSALLAKAGALDGKRATTNKAAFHWVTEQSAKVEWVRQARWVEDGRFFSSSGVSAGMDMSLAVIARLLGQERAEEVATWAEYDWHQNANWDPFAKIHSLVD